MGTMTTVPVGVRLPSEAWQRYSAAARRLGLPLSTYLRQRLDDQDHLVDELAALRAELGRKATPLEPRADGAPAFAPGLLVEMLLLLRMLAGPQKSTIAQKEVERREMASWK
jgi:predicted DNA-binding protein